MVNLTVCMYIATAMHIHYYVSYKFMYSIKVFRISLLFISLVATFTTLCSSIPVKLVLPLVLVDLLELQYAQNIISRQ